jgi:hypothetical protein
METYKVDDEFCILIGNWEEGDKELFFGPISEKDIFIEFPVSLRYPVLLRDLGIFQSSSQASNSGWNKEIPEGFTDMRIGKLRRRLTILKITKST